MTWKVWLTGIVCVWLLSKFVAFLERDEKRRRRLARFHAARQRRWEEELRDPKGSIEMTFRSPATVRVNGSVEIVPAPASVVDVATRRLPPARSARRLLAHNADTD